MPAKPKDLDEVVTLIYKCVATHRANLGNHNKYVIADDKNEAIGNEPVDKLLKKALAEKKRFEIKKPKQESVPKTKHNVRRKKDKKDIHKTWGLPESADPKLWVRRMLVKQGFNDWSGWEEADKLAEVQKCYDTLFETTGQAKPDANAMLTSIGDAEVKNLYLYYYDYGNPENKKQRIVVALRDMEHAYNGAARQFTMTIGFYDDGIKE